MRDEKKADSMSIVEKMSNSKDKELLLKYVLVWGMGQEMDRVMGNYLEEKELLAGFMAKQKEKSKGVVDRLIRGQDSSLSTMCFSAWSERTAENSRARDKEKAQAETQEEMLQLQAQMKAYQDRKKEETGAVLARMNAASDSGLV